MAIVKMKHVRLLAFQKHKTALLKDLMWLNSVEVSTLTADVFDEKVAAGLSADDRDEVGTVWAERTDALAAAIDVLAPYATGKKTVFTAPRELAREDYEAFEEQARYILADANDVLFVKQTLAELKSEKNKVRSTAVALEPWQSVPLELDKPVSSHVRYLLGTVPSEAFDEEAFCRLADEHGFTFETVKHDAAFVYITVFFLKESADNVQRLLEENRFDKWTAKDFDGTAEDNLALCKERLEQIAERTEELYGKLRDYAKRLDEFENAYDMASALRDVHDVRKKFLQTQSSFLLDGWCPVSRTEELLSLCDRYDAYCELSDPEDHEQPPILLKNNWFASAFEGITEMYALPHYRGIDPNFMMSPFFFIFFGMMLGDLGYGALVTLGCAFALLFCSFKPGMKKMLRMFLYCGISTMVWGVLFGSFFGDVIPVFSETFLGTKAEFAARWFNPMDEPLTLFLLSFAVGYLHLMVGLGMRMFMLIRDKKYLAALCDVGFWMILLLGIVVFAAPMLLTTLPAVVGTVGMWMVIGGAGGLILTQGRDKKNPIMKLLMGIYSLYDITSYLSDILSYSRILALSLSTSVICSVFNKLGVMFGGGVFGFIAFLVVFLLGTALNLALSLLSTYVHSSRLQFIEFFSKFYEGGGTAFEPMRVQTKYTEIKKTK